MKKFLKRLLPVPILLWVMACVFVLAVNPKKTQAKNNTAAQEYNPEQVLQLYIETMIHSNPKAREKLNRYLQPLYSSSAKNNKNFNKSLRVFEPLVEDAYKSFLSRLPASLVTKEIEKETKAFYQSLFSLVQTAKCKPLDGTRARQGKHAYWLMSYECSFRVPQKSSLLQMNVEKLSSQELKKVLQDSVRDIARSQKRKSFQGQFVLVETKSAKKIYYMSLNPNQLTIEVIDKFLSALEGK